MIPRLIHATVIIVIFLASLSTHAAQQSTILETDLFIVAFPDSIKPYRPKSHKIEKDTFTYVYIESGKATSSSILIIISAERLDAMGKRDLNSALYAIASGLRKSTIERNCKAHPTALIETSIGNNKALYFEINDHSCEKLVEKYWSVITRDHFIAFYISKPIERDDVFFNEIQTAIKQVKFK